MHNDRQVSFNINRKTLINFKLFIRDNWLFSMKSVFSDYLDNLKLSDLDLCVNSDSSNHKKCFTVELSDKQNVKIVTLCKILNLKKSSFVEICLLNIMKNYISDDMNNSIVYNTYKDALCSTCGGSLFNNTLIQYIIVMFCDNCSYSETLKSSCCGKKVHVFDPSFGRYTYKECYE